MATPLLPANWPVPVLASTLTGNIVQLEPLRPSHLPELAQAGSKSSIWEFTTSRGDTHDAMQTYINGLLRDWEVGTAVPFVVRRRRDDKVVGCTRLKELDRRHRRAILGSWFAPIAWRTGVNLEAKLLLLEFGFRDLGCVRIEFHTDTNNARSRKSLEQLGAKLEGVLRTHQITRNGGLRDSAIYSILGGEWAAIKTKIVERLKQRSIVTSPQGMI